MEGELLRLPCLNYESYQTQ